MNSESSARHPHDQSPGKQLVSPSSITEHTKLMAQSREEAMQRMVEQAEKMGANAILGTRFMTSMVAAGAAEFLAYGTAVVVE